MNTKPKAQRYNIRPMERPQTAAAPAPGSQLFDNQEDGFGSLDFRSPDPNESAPTATSAREALTDALGTTVPDATAAIVGGDAAPVQSGALPSDAAGNATASTGATSEAETEATIAAELNAIASERLTTRQLRRAMFMASRYGIEVSSEFDAVYRLRKAGIDPFRKTAVLQLVSAPDDEEPDNPVPGPFAGPSGIAETAAQVSAPLQATGRALTRLPGDTVQLPQRVTPAALPSPVKRAEVNQANEIKNMQRDITRRRRRRLALLCVRMFVFIGLPTILAGWYFYNLATPMYSTRTAFVIQQAGPSGGSSGALAGLFSGTALATSQDSIAVQDYLQSLEAMARLEADRGFRSHFERDTIDPLQRLDPTDGQESAYKIYKKHVKISFDTTDGVVRMEVIAAEPQVAVDWSNQLVSYAEEQIDHLTQRLRADQMQDAKTGYEEARLALTEAQRRLIELQEKFKILSTETEIGLVTGQISSLEAQLLQDRLSLIEMEANESPNAARVDPLKRRIATLEDEISSLRAKLTEGSGGEQSLAQVQSDLLIAQADMQTRQMLMAQALQAMETARVEANRQVRYLSLAVRPTLPDEAAYPRAFENTLVTMLILLGIYLMVTMTAAILREQVTS